SRSYIGQLKEGKENVFWPGKIENFAVSAGTSGKGKHLPLTDTRLQSDRRFMQKVALSYLKQRPNLFKLLGSHLSMPGSLERQEELLIGEISGFSALHRSEEHRLNSSHVSISYAVFCLKKKK